MIAMTASYNKWSCVACVKQYMCVKMIDNYPSLYVCSYKPIPTLTLDQGYAGTACSSHLHYKSNQTPLWRIKGSSNFPMREQDKRKCTGQGWFSFFLCPRLKHNCWNPPLVIMCQLAQKTTLQDSIKRHQDVKLFSTLSWKTRTNEAWVKISPKC